MQKAYSWNRLTILAKYEILIKKSSIDISCFLSAVCFLVNKDCCVTIFWEKKAANPSQLWVQQEDFSPNLSVLTSHMQRNFITDNQVL